MRLPAALAQARVQLAAGVRSRGRVRRLAMALICAGSVLITYASANAQSDGIRVSIAPPTLAAGTGGHLFEIEGDPDSAAEVVNGGWVLTRTGDGTGVLKVNLTVSESGGNFVPASIEGSQTLTFPDGVNTVEYRPIRDDATKESHGTVTVAIEAGDGYAVDADKSSAEVAVRDDDYQMELTIDPLDLTVVEGEAAQLYAVLRTTDTDTFSEADDVGRVMRIRDGSLVQGRNVNYSRSWLSRVAEATSPDDYGVVSRMFSFTASDFVADGDGYMARKALEPFQIVDDMEAEGPERFLGLLDRAPGTIAKLAAIASRDDIPDLLENGEVIDLSTATTISAVVTITDRLPSDDAMLSRLTLTETDSGNDITLDPAYDPAVFQYTAEVPVGVETITLDAAANDTGATLKYLNVKESELADADEETDGFQAGLMLGATVFGVQVEAENGVKQIYSVSVFRPGPPLAVSLDTVAGDDVLNIQEKADGFSISGTVLNDKSDAMSNATVTVEIAGQTLTATSASDGTWSVDVPAIADGLGEPEVTATVSAVKAPFLPSPEVTRTLKVDLTPPKLVRASAMDDRLTLTYDEMLGENDVPPSAFAVSVNGVVLSAPMPVAVGGSDVTLGLASAISPDDTVTISYTAPTGVGARFIQDAAGNAADSLTDHPVENTTPPGERCAGSNGSVRLADGSDSKEGRVEVCADDDTSDTTPARWGVVCDDYWTNEDADVVCSSLGFERSEPRAGRFLKSYFGAGSGPIWLDDMRCRGTESNLLECLVQSGSVASDAIGQHNCRATEIVGVRCMAAGDPLKPHVTTHGDLTHPGDDERYEPGDILSVTVLFNEPMVVTSSSGTPTIGMALGDSQDDLHRSARYSDGSGTDRLTFQHRVTADDGVFEVLRVVANSLTTNGGTIRNADGLDAILAHDSSVEPIERFLQLHRVSVADATAQEGEPLQFVVSLSYPQSGEVSVSYRTEPGTATAGADFETTSGTLTFARGQTQRTIPVATLDDAHDDGGETLTLVLADARGVRISDDTAIGTILNSDPMPQAWLARFGRAAADHAVEAIGTRFDSAGAPPTSRNGAGASSLAELWQLAGLETVSGTFNNASTGWLTDMSAWARITDSRFAGADGALSLDGKVSTATMGVDGRRGRWLTGIALSHSTGEGGYRHETAAGGRIASTLSSLHPYAHYSAGERLSLWGVLGYGTGDLTLAADGAENRIHTGLGSKMLSFGGRGQLQPTVGRFELAWVSDALLTETQSESTNGLHGADAETSRVRLMLEGSASIELANGGILTPTVEAGVRHDAGDAETGAGVELGGGLAYAAGRVTVQLDGRTLLMHRDSAYEEWGFSSTIVYRPRDDGRGLAFNVGSARGVTQSGERSLWNAFGVGHRAHDRSGAAAQQYELELGYGLARQIGPGLWYPFVAANAGNGGEKSLRAGFRISSGRNFDASAEIGRLVLADGSPDHAIQFSGTLHW